MTSTTGHHVERDPRRDGFTLLELIVVLVLISTVLAMAAPSLRGFSRARRTADAAAQMLSLTHLARSQAVAEACVYRLNIDTETASYWLTLQQAGAFVALDSEHGRQFYLPDGVSVTLDSPLTDERPEYIHFYPDGRSDQATIELADAEGEVLQIICPSASERFRIVLPSEADRL